VAAYLVESGTMVFLHELRALIPSLRALSDAAVQKKLGPEKLAEAIEFVEDYLALGAPKVTQRNEYMALTGTVLGCLVDWMKEREIPVTAKTILDSIYTLPQAVEICFPSYAKAGLLHAIVSPQKLST
jgi:hypothetical protein